MLLAPRTQQGARAHATASGRLTTSFEIHASAPSSSAPCTRHPTSSRIPRPPRPPPRVGPARQRRPPAGEYSRPPRPRAGVVPSDSSQEPPGDREVPLRRGASRSFLPSLRAAASFAAPLFGFRVRSLLLSFFPPPLYSLGPLPPSAAACKSFQKRYKGAKEPSRRSKCVDLRRWALLLTDLPSSMARVLPLSIDAGEMARYARGGLRPFLRQLQITLSFLFSSFPFLPWRFCLGGGRLGASCCFRAGGLAVGVGAAARASSIFAWDFFSELTWKL